MILFYGVGIEVHYRLKVFKVDAKQWIVRI